MMNVGWLQQERYARAFKYNCTRNKVCSIQKKKKKRKTIVLVALLLVPHAYMQGILQDGLFFFFMFCFVLVLPPLWESISTEIV